ncbi:MAG: hypothetical protein WCJ56_05530 [bacterium]
MKQKSQLVGMLGAAILLAGALATSAAEPTKLNVSAATNITVSGYVQGRYTENTGDAQPGGNFDARRLYLNIKADVDENTDAVLLLQNVPTVAPLEAYGEYHKDAVNVKLGINRIPFGVETPASSASLITLERSRALKALAYDDFTFERGLFVSYTCPQTGAKLATAFTNGEPLVKGVPSISNDTNKRKDVIARFSYPIDGGEVGVSYLNGEASAINAINDPSKPYGGTSVFANAVINRYGADAQYKNGNLKAVAEIVSGKTDSIDSAGGYVSLGYMAMPNCQPYFRFDTFDPNNANKSDNYRAFTFGMQHNLNPRSSIKVEYQRIEDHADVSGLTGTFGAQYQVTF